MCLKEISQLKKYCSDYNISMDHIVDVISDLKVIPMIRGKSFEFTVSDLLKKILPSKDWGVKHLNINAQPGVQDIDVLIIRKRDNKQIRIECKLTKNDSFRINNQIAKFSVKCMRSRTVSDNPVATRMAANYGIPRNLLLNHADSYRDSDFDFVVTSLGNSFWMTLNDKYTFNGAQEQFNFLSNLFPNHFKSFKNFKKDAFNFLLFAQSSQIKVSPQNNLICKKRVCRNGGTSTNCGFIPNYPLVNLNDVVNGTSHWKLIKNVKEVFNNF